VPQQTICQLFIDVEIAREVLRESHLLLSPVLRDERRVYDLDDTIFLFYGIIDEWLFVLIRLPFVVE
jgi:hypothetical protein